MNAPEADPHDLPAATDVGVVGVPFDGGVSRQPGARYGPEEIRRESGRYARNDGGVQRRYGAARRLRRRDDTGLRGRPHRDDGCRSDRRGVRETVRSVADAGFPVVLGGDHYLTYPSFCGVAEARDERLGMIHLDVHSDVYGSWGLHGEHWHGSPMNLIDDTDYGGYDTHAMVGLRAVEAPEFPEFVAQEGLHVSYARDIHDEGLGPCLERAIDHATDRVDSVYLTVDIDVVDPTVAPGTGTPEFGGIDATQLLSAMERLGDCDAVCAVDLVEVAPRLDPSRMTQRVGAAALSRFLEAKFGRG